MSEGYLHSLPLNQPRVEKSILVLIIETGMYISCFYLILCVG